MPMFFRFNCNFGLEDITKVIPQDMQKLLLSTQQKWKHHKQEDTLKKKKGEIIILEFLVSNQGTKMSIRISKTLDKCGCQ